MAALALSRPRLSPERRFVDEYHLILSSSYFLPNDSIATDWRILLAFPPYGVVFVVLLGIYRFSGAFTGGAYRSGV